MNFNKKKMNGRGQMNLKVPVLNTKEADVAHVKLRHGYGREEIRDEPSFNLARRRGLSGCQQTISSRGKN